MLTHIRHSGRPVSNLQTALFFYRDLLGMKVKIQDRLDRYDVLKLLGIEDCDLTYVKLEAEWGALLELYYFENAQIREAYFGGDTVSFDHVAFTVSDLMELHQKLLENGVTVISSPSIDNECKHRLFFARDFDGNLCEFVEVLNADTGKG